MALKGPTAMSDPRAIQQFQALRSSLAKPDYAAVQDTYWNRSRRENRGVPTPVGSGLTTPQEDADMGVAQPGGAASASSATACQDADPPSLVQPFTIQDQTAVGLTAAEMGVDINDQTAVQQWLQQPVQNNQQVCNMVRSYHHQVIRPAMYNLVLQLEAAFKTIDEQVFQTRKELQWLSQDNRMAQKYQAALQVLTSGWPNHMKPEARLFMLAWMLSETPEIADCLRNKGTSMTIWPKTMGGT